MAIVNNKVKELREATKSEDVDAYHELINTYTYGYYGEAEDSLEAKEWCLQLAEHHRKNAEKGDANSWFKLASVFITYSAIRDFAEALKWLRIGAEHGSVHAQNLLGDMYSDPGNGVEQDFAEAIKWYGLAAEQGGTAGTPRGCSMTYFSGVNRYENDRRPKAVKLFCEAASGDLKSLTEIGKMYLNGLHDMPVDYDEAQKWFRLAAERGDVNAVKLLNKMTDDGMKKSKRKKKDNVIEFNKSEK